MSEKKKPVNKNMGRRKKKGFGQYRRCVISISAVLVLLCGIIGVDSVSLHKKNKAYKQQEYELTQQIEAEKERKKDVEVLKERVDTDEDYEKELAEEKLGLVDPNEIVFKAVD